MFTCFQGSWVGEEDLGVSRFRVRQAKLGCSEDQSGGLVHNVHIGLNFVVLCAV